MNKIIERAFEAVLIAQKKLHEATSDEEAKIAEVDLKKSQDQLIILEARLELLNSLGKLNSLPAVQDADLNEELIEKFMELLMK